ncbi:MAG: HlyD family efflux transporter periplasmic adaptor subunit [Acidimicrobiia bacterium]|nr:HlyD family efflux transporter periplasmic adaptor subunit [Acidimicrobiia bacterium]
MSAIGNPRISPVEAPPSHSAPAAQPTPGGKFPRKLSLLSLLILAGALAAWQSWLKPAAPDPATAAISLIRTTRVATANLDHTLRISGQTSSREYQNITASIMRGPDAGREMILLFLIQSGKQVKKGDLLAQIDSKSLEDHVDDIAADITNAEADIRKRKAEQAVDLENLNQTIRVAKSDLERATLDAKPSEVRTPIDQELLKLAVDEAAARYKQAQSDVEHKLVGYKSEIRILEITKWRHENHRERHRIDLVRFTIRSPMDGLAVVQATFRGGEWNLIQQGDQLFPGQLFMKVVNPANMQVEALMNQSESDLVRISQKTSIQFDAFAGMKFPGKIYTIGALATGGFRQNNYIRSIPVRISIDGSDPRLIPDLSASVDILLKREENVTRVPLGAVFQDGSQDVVFVKSAGKFQKRPVTLGAKNATHARVISGLSSGEEIALSRPPSGV